MNVYGCNVAVLYFKGGGYEPEAHYPQWKRLNQPIERRQVFHESLIKLIEGMTIIYTSSTYSSETTIPSGRG